MANLAFVGKEYKWFVGQVPPNQLANKQEKGAWGNRVKIRIQGYHPAGPEVTNENLPWALIAKPTSQGSYNYGSTGLAGGEWVTGYFLDESCQIPVITHVLGTNQIENLTTLDEAKETTYFKNVTRYNYGITAANHQQKGGSKPKAPAQPTKEEVDKAVPENTDPPIEKPITESGQQQAADEVKATEAKAIESEKISQSAPSTSSKYGSPDNPITNSADLNTAISVKSDASSIEILRTNVQPTIEQIDAAGKNGYRFTPFRDGRPGGSFKNSLLD